MDIIRQFPYTNFHDLNLDWLLNNMRKLLTDWIEYQEKWNVLYDDITTAFDDFKAVFDEHIAGYDRDFQTFINSINVTTELRKVFDQAVADGTVASIINPVIATKTTEWLEANITEPVGVVIDKSLTVDGACADAKATGDAIALNSERINDISENFSDNLFNEKQILKATDWNFTNNIYSGKVGDWHTAFRASNTAGFEIEGGFDENTQYTLSLDFQTSTTPIATGNIIAFRAYYTDGSEASLITIDVQPAWVHRKATTAPNKTLRKIALQYSNENASNNILYLRNIQFTAGKTELNYQNFEITAIDRDARQLLPELIGYSENDFDIGNIAISTSGWVYGDQPDRVRTKPNTTILLNPGDIIKLSNYNNARYYIGWLNDDNIYNLKGWLTSDFHVYERGQYVILLAFNNTESLYNKYDLLKLLKIEKNNSIKSMFSLSWFNNGKIRIQAHKGLVPRDPSSDIIENSAKAFEYAGKNNIFICETDIRLTRDDHFVCMHDATVDATTNGTGAVIDLTLAEIRELYLLRADGTVSNEKVPTIEDFLITCKKYNMTGAIELKDVNISRYVTGIIDTIKMYGMEENVILITSEWAVNRYNIRQLTVLPLSLITNDSLWESTFKFAKNNDNIGITYDRTGNITLDKIFQCHTEKIPFNIFTETDFEEADNYFNMGADIITTPYLTEELWK